jgi:hypothetical protein
MDVEYQEELDGWVFGDQVDYFEDEERLSVVQLHHEELTKQTQQQRSNDKQTQMAAPAADGAVATEADIMSSVQSSSRQHLRRKASVPFPNRTRHRVLNQISFEFSGHELRSLVKSPQFLRDMDWIDQAWPSKWRVERGLYPAVQYYCLTSGAGSYTDFHVDFGGTSVW